MSESDLIPVVSEMAARFWDVEVGSDDDGGTGGPAEAGAAADVDGDASESGSIVSGVVGGREAAGEKGDWAESVRWIWGGDEGNMFGECPAAELEAGKNDGWFVGDEGRDPFYKDT